MHEIQKYRKNCESVLTPGIPGLWNLEDMDLGCVSKNIKYKTKTKYKKYMEDMEVKVGILPFDCQCINTFLLKYNWY